MQNSVCRAILTQMSEISSALSAFSKKLSRFTKATPDGKPDTPPRADVLAQRKILEHDQAFAAEVVRTYTKYRFPYKTLGQDSVEAAAIAADEDALLAAYKLFCAVREANAQYGTEQTRIKDDVIATPLAHKSAYTQGDDFVYLQCWLRYEQGVEDVVPQFAQTNAGQTQTGAYTLQFVPAAAYHAGYKKKEIAAVIQQEFYPTTAV